MRKTRVLNKWLANAGREHRPGLRLVAKSHCRLGRGFPSRKPMIAAM